MDKRAKDRFTQGAAVYNLPKIDKAHKKRLDWFFDFLQLDLDGCTIRQINKLCIDWNCWIKAKYTKMKTSHSPDEQNFLNEQGEHVVRDLEKDIAQHRPDFLIYDLPIKSMQRELIEKSRPLFERIEGKHKIEKPGNGLERGKARYGSAVTAKLHNENLETLLQVRIVDTITPRIETAYILPDDIAAISFIFYQEIDNLPLDAFKRCDECGSWFLQLSGKEKNFCSIPCIKRNRQRKKRKEQKENDPEGYKRVKQDARERARKSYETKIENKLGKGIKPARRPRIKED